MVKFPKRYIFLSSLIFGLSILTGIIAVKQTPIEARQNMREVSEENASRADSPIYTTFAYIFFNNALINLICILSFFTFGLISLYILLTNGYTIGVVADIFSQEKGAVKTVAIFSPHGIFEIPAFLIATGLGIFLGVAFFRYMLYDEPLEQSFRHALNIYMTVVVPLNLLAALIEAYLVPFIYRMS
jgi:stage II sporulation protein M